MTLKSFHSVFWRGKVVVVAEVQSTQRRFSVPIFCCLVKGDWCILSGYGLGGAPIQKYRERRIGL